jgi:hypothetical protein
MKIMLLILCLFLSGGTLNKKISKTELDKKINKNKYQFQEIVQSGDTLKFVQYRFPDGRSVGFGIHGNLRFAKEKEINDSMEVWLERYE